MTPDLTFVVSSYDRPKELAACLHALNVQTNPNIQILVTDNSPEQIMRPVVLAMNDPRFSHVDTHEVNGGTCCYTSAVAVLQFAQGEYLCFPSEDSYYVPVFAERMVNKARAEDLDLVYCNMIYDPRIGSECSVLITSPVVKEIDKTGFIVRRDKFPGFGYDGVSLPMTDGLTIEYLVKTLHFTHGKHNGVMVVHN